MLRLKSILFVLLFFPFTTFSVQQGTLGQTSTGEVIVTIVIPNLVQISGLSDISIAPYDTGNTGTSPACIYSNVGTGDDGTYYLTPSSANNSTTNFRAISGGGAYITYTAQWTSTGTGATTITLASGTKSVALGGASTTTTNCASTSGTNATLTVSISDAQAAGVAAGTYTDTATLLITPS